jgi:hypothetical protein
MPPHEHSSSVIDGPGSAGTEAQPLQTSSGLALSRAFTTGTDLLIDCKSFLKVFLKLVFLPIFTDFCGEAHAYLSCDIKLVS